MEKIQKLGVVMKSTGSFYHVRTVDGENLSCIIRGNLRIRGIRSTNPVAVGDNVRIEFDNKNEQQMITEVMERKNYIIRKSTNLSKQSHIIAANLDQAILIVTLKDPETPLEFIDRYLVTAEAYKIPAVLVFNKTDIYQEYENILLEHLQKIYDLAGYNTITTSVIQNKNIDILANLLRNKVSLLSGLSGVGKSSLINVVEPGLALKTGIISDYHKTGMHVTTFAEMFTLKNGGSIIDTPGVRGFGVVDMKKEELYHYFPEIFKVSSKCKFYNCTHIHEPGCVVPEAIKEGRIAIERYKSYVSLFHDSDEKYR